MAVSLIPVVLVLGVLVVLVAGVVVVSQRQNRRVAEAERPGASTLRFRVPEGQDPAAVLTSLDESGYDAVTESDVVVVTVATGAAEEREQVRAAIERAGVGLEDEAPAGNRVRFLDE